MRPKMNTQSELNLQPSNLDITNEYYAKYDRISAILDENPAMVDGIHDDLARALEEAAVEDRYGAKFEYTSDTVCALIGIGGSLTAPPYPDQCAKQSAKTFSSGDVSVCSATTSAKIGGKLALIGPTYRFTAVSY